MAEARKGGCCNTAEIEEKIEPSQCHSLASDSSSGRVLFKGVDMAFLNVNGHQMFTLNEILEKLFPTTPRTTVCTRMEKMNAFRHACTKQEIRKMKALGGAKPSAINCTMIARKDVAEYYLKFKVKNAASQESSSPSKANMNLKNPQINGPASAVLQFSKIKSDSVADDDMVLGGNGPVTVEDLQICRSNEEVYTVTDYSNKGHTWTTNKATQIQTGTNESGKENANSGKRYACFDEQSQTQSVRDSKLSNSVSWCNAGVISQLAGSRTTGEIRGEIDQRASNPSRINKKRRKRKRRTNLEILQSCSNNIGNGSGILKRQRKACNSKGNGRYAEKKRRQQLSVDVDDSSRNPPTCYLDLAVFNSSSKQSHRQAFQALNLEYVFKDERGKPAKRYLDNNNNNNEIEVPRSPTLLLKRSVNNEWCIAKSILPRLSSLSFDDEEKTPSEPDERLSKVESSQQAHATSAADTTMNISWSPATVPKPAPVQTSPQSTKALASNKVKNSGRCVSTKNPGRITGKKSEAINTDELELSKANANQLTHSRSNVPAKDKNPSPKFIGNQRCIIDNAKAAKSNSTSRNSSTNKPKKTDVENLKERSDGLEKPIINQANDGAIKRKRRRRVQLDTFRLIETIPYPSLLMVRDGDLCPSYTMTYSSTKHVPGCCHPLWRWRLGKPVFLPKQSQAKSSPGEQQSGENYGKEGSVGFKNDDVSSKESTDSQA